MPCKTLIAAVLLTGSMSVIASMAPAAEKKSAPKRDSTAAEVETALRAEIVGQVDRREKLAGALREQPDAAAARWQAGYIRAGDSWRSFDQMSESADSEVCQKYVMWRALAAKTSAAQLDLANWCRDHGLPEQERAHLTASLPAASEVVESAILRRLGRILVGNRWISKEELANWRESNRHTTEAVKRWSARLLKIVDFIEGSPRLHEIGMTKLEQLTDPAAIPAIEYVLCGHESTANPAVAKLEKMAAYEATLALAKQAMFSQWPEVRERAAAALQSRRLEDFVPDLIGLLASPRKAAFSQGWYYTRDEGPRLQLTTGQISLVSCYIVARETDNQFQVDVLRTVDYRLNDLIAMRGQIFSEVELSTEIWASNNPWINGMILGMQIDMDRADAQQRRDAELALEEANERTEELNRRTIAILAGVSKRDPTPEPKDWWQWWSDFSDAERLGEKPVVVQVEQSYLGNPAAQFQVGVPRGECLAAGTPVWTDHGPMLIESISIGDLVLSKDIETGCLAYKPVLQTTIRPAKELFGIRFDQETIVCTGGHQFWNSGTGWIKARDLDSQPLLHTATGNSPAWGISKREKAETYNLVVADFHTYFVGQAGILSQDVMPTKPTDKIVPGLARARVVGKNK